MNSDPQRPDPEKLLAKITSQEQRSASTRGQLRIYLGAAPGVGKTYAMLNEAKRRRTRGTDVVIGYVETYGRPLTVQATEGLETIPRRIVQYRGTQLEEMDTDAILARHPAVVLVDELAHTNAPGSTYPKRWQDVDLLRDAGIHVISTMNIQHLESLKDRVEQITGITVRETVPDSVLDHATDMELIDIAPDALRARMRHGNIYPPERATKALENFFRPGNLAALRELALRRTAEEVDGQLETYMKEHNLNGWAVDERVLVCIDQRSLSTTLVRRGTQLARRFKCELFAVTVHNSLLGERDRALLAQHVTLAAESGAHVYEAQGEDIAEALAAFVSEHRITQVIVGHSQRSRWYEFVHGSLIRKLLRRLPDVDIHVIAERSEPRV